ncbi:MAG TPA: hypothetical protein PKM97_06685 [Bacteroidia bacterium]|nr:hypothetical protein [Bacteroidia bacterium]
MTKNSVRSLVFVYMIMLITSCMPDAKKEDRGGIQMKVQRFETDLFSLDPADMGSELESMKKKYGRFFDLFAFQITRLGSRDSAQMASNFSSFITDTNFLAVYKDCSSTFGDFSNEKKDLESAFDKYSVEFPESTIPDIITLISVFSYPIVVDSAILGVSLDMYLGTESKYYQTLDPPLPLYLRNRMRKEYLVPDAVRGWLESDFGIDESSAKIVDMMVSQGRLLYALDLLMPETPDTLKSGFSNAQLNWCRDNESRIWSFFIDNSLLFSDDPNLLQKYVNDGPTTNGFPKESPGNIGKFAGWQIVKSYIKNNKDVSLTELLNEKDLMKIFRESRYKPAR